MFHSLTDMKWLELVFDLAQWNNIDVPASWIKEEKAGKSNGAFMKIGNINYYVQHHLAYSEAPTCLCLMTIV